PNASSRKGGGGWSTDCRQSYEAYKKGVLLPSREDKGFFKFAVTARDVLVRDRGSLILSPKIGIHENVGACDFESMFPHIIKNYNLSYETVKPNYVQKNGQGFLCKISEQILKRRLELKRSRADYPKDSEDWWYVEQRQLALKMILVCFYGYSGCFANKFNNVTLYEEINAVARNCMLTTLRLARENSFETIYGDCDSIFEKKPDAKFADFEELCALVAQQTGLPMAVDRHYQFLVLLPQESDPDIEATRHYFGKLMNGDLYFRGIELRRHDYPKFLKDFQLKLMEVLFDADSSEKVMSRQYKEAMNFVLENYEKIVAGDIAPDELVISKILRKPVNEYRSMFPHVSAAMNMVQRGKKLRVGQAVNFVYVNSEHANPLRRVMPAELMNGDHYYYDREKYGEILLDIAETILGWNGFKRGRFGVKPKPKNFLEELRREKQQELILELRNLQDGRA
ncbi:MAG: DNA polymerase domain-containing protein, partial [Candidatus Bathyarchaeia archaeon]